jgi:hypothetical protein
MKDHRLLTLSILNLLGFLGTIAVNALANIMPIGGITTGEVSDLYPNLFTPAGLTFAIWGLIYLLLAIFVIYQLLPSVRRDPQKGDFVRRIGPFFFISSLANMGWIFAWHYQNIALSLVLMLVLLASLLMTYLRLGVGKAEVTRAVKYAVHIPFSVYLGWITIATIANFTILLRERNWGAFGFGEQFWAVAVIAVGIAIALAMLFTRRDMYYALVVDWALLGILLKRLSVATADDRAVVVVTIMGLAIITVLTLVRAVQRKVY